MSSNSNRPSPLSEAVQNINPTAPPDEVAENLRKIAEKYALTNNQTIELIRGFFSHFDIDVSGPPPMVILRSGYQILAEGDLQKVVDHLKNAIVGESTVRFTSGETGDWQNLWSEISAEVEHVAFATHETSVRNLLAYLLLEAAQAQWSKLVNDLFPFLEVDSVPTPDIPAFLKLAKKKLVLLLGKDIDEGLETLHAIQKVVENSGYQCQLIKELPEHSEMGLIGKVLFTALSARFVIIENSAPSGHLYEIPFVRMAECVIAIMQREGQGATWMTEDMLPKHALIERFRYTDDSLESSVQEAILWAEQRISENIKINKGAWPWANK